MSRASAFDANAMFLAAAAVIGAGVLAYGGLFLLTRPAGLENRLAEITRQVDEADRLKARVRGPSPYPVGAVCDGGADAGVADLKQTLASTVGPAGVAVGAVTISPQTPDEANRGLQPIRISIEATGPYAGLISLLQTLSKSTPSVFVDTLDLKSNSGVVFLKLTGRLFCAPASL